MLLFNLLYFGILTLSVSSMWHFSEIFAKPRNIISRIPYIRRPLMCPECSSFWFGLSLSFIYNPILLDLNFMFLSNILCGLVSYFFAHVVLMKKHVENKMDFIK
jgi:hypothetical protein